MLELTRETISFSGKKMLRRACTCNSSSEGIGQKRRRRTEEERGGKERERERVERNSSLHSADRTKLSSKQLFHSHEIALTIILTLTSRTSSPVVASFGSLAEMLRSRSVRQRRAAAPRAAQYPNSSDNCY